MKAFLNFFVPHSSQETTESLLTPNLTPASRFFPELPIWIYVLLLIGVFCPRARASAHDLTGTVVDEQRQPVAGAQVTAFSSSKALLCSARTGSDGRFHLACGEVVHLIEVEANGYQSIRRMIHPGTSLGNLIEIRLHLLLSRRQSVTVSAAEATTLVTPDPAQQVYLRQNALDANPGRPGAPVSIPGLPVESASGGIKAPQYFAPGVAGDHGEPIAQYIRVGGFLLPNNLSANAHGNGYADPNILIPAAIETVQTDSGAFNVQEGNHAVNLGVAYGLGSRLQPALTLTADRHDADLVAGWSPAGEKTPAWVAVEIAAGNGFLQRAEHRRQYKVNGYRVWAPGRHELTLVGIGYYGSSSLPGLVPIGVAGLHDTIDPRQKDQTHTAEMALNDRWQASSLQQVQLSGFFRTYDLVLDSNFGDGLIRQSEFRTVSGGSGNWLAKANDWLSVLAGVDAQRDAPHPLNLDHSTSTDLTTLKPFHRVMSNQVTIDDLAPYGALSGGLSRHLRYYAGVRQDETGFDNTDRLNPGHSFNRWVGVTSPKATIAFIPGIHSFLPTLSWSAGEAFYTNDPRIGMGMEQGSLVSRIHSYQMTAGEDVAGAEFRLTLNHVTSEGSLAKIDPDTGLQIDEGPGRLRVLTLAVNRYFALGMLRASLAKADARDLTSGLPTPEAPRTIIDISGILDQLPLRLQARGEFERVGAKPLGDGFVGVPVTELRLALLRNFFDERLEAGVNVFLASGYTGQTTEVLALTAESTPMERVVGVRLPSTVSISARWNLRPHRLRF